VRSLAKRALLALLAAILSTGLLPLSELTWNQFGDLKPLADLASLQSLDLADITIADFRPLAIPGLPPAFPGRALQ